MRSTRAKWKGPFLGGSLKNSILKKEISKDFVYNRNEVIPKLLVGKTVLIYNGRDLKRVFINREKVGYKFGEFSFTRKSFDKRLKTKKKKK